MVDTGPHPRLGLGCPALSGLPPSPGVWGDGANWATGHWLNGRIEGMPLDRLIAAICADYALPSA
jgi:hypothetical protein